MLTYKKNGDYLIVDWDEKYNDFLESIDDDIKKEGSVYLIPVNKETELNKFINYIHMMENGKSRKNQSKYHREVSDDETEEVRRRHTRRESVPAPTPEPISKSKNKKKYNQPDPMKYYKSFASKPVDFNKIKRKKGYEADSDSDNYEEESSESYSSSSYGSSSSDDFPEASTPRKNSRGRMSDLIDVVYDLKKRITRIENMIFEKRK